MVPHFYLQTGVVLEIFGVKTGKSMAQAVLLPLPLISIGTPSRYFANFRPFFQPVRRADKVFLVGAHVAYTVLQPFG